MCVFVCAHVREVTYVPLCVSVCVCVCVCVLSQRTVNRERESVDEIIEKNFNELCTHMHTSALNRTVESTLV